MRRLTLALLISFPAVLSGLPAAEVTRDSRPVRLLRSWEEPVKTPDGREIRRRTDVVFDYAAGVAKEIVYRPDGTVQSTRKITQNLPVPSEEEIAEAVGIVEGDAELSRMIARRSAVFEGGFGLEEAPGKRCGPGSRCLQIQLISPDRTGLIRWVVVDLARREIAYPAYVPVTRRAVR